METSSSSLFSQFPNLSLDSGILRKSLLSLKKKPFYRVPNPHYLKTAIYKHYIITLDTHPERAEDCVVFDTKKETTSHFHTGLSLKGRSCFSFSYWKDNIFVLYGGVSPLPGRNSSLFANERAETDVHFMKVIEEEERILFEVESCGLTDKRWWSREHSAAIYQDNMYVLSQFMNGGGGGLFGGRIQKRFVLTKFDLCTRTWSQCETTGDLPDPNNDKPAAIFNGKIYFVENVSIESGGGGGGLFGGGARDYINSLYSLDLENMECRKIKNGNLFPNGAGQLLLHAALVGDKVYFSGSISNEFLIFDPSNNQILFSEGLPPRDGWRIRSFENHAILFRFDRGPDLPAIEYQTLDISAQSQSQSPQKQEEVFVKEDPLVATPSQLSHMELLWKEKPFADVTFVVQKEEIAAHRVILLKCRYFQNMFKSGMMEASSDKINVPEISAANFKAILEYIYLDKINLSESLAMELIILADMYFLPNLKTDCENYLSAKLTVENFVKVMKVAENADSEKLEKKVVSFLSSNIEKVKQEVDIRIIPPELFIKAISELKSGKKN